MKLDHALSKEKTFISSINGQYVEYFYNYNLLEKEIPDIVSLCTLTNEQDQIIGIFDLDSILKEAPSGPGFYLIYNYYNNEEVIIELKQTIPFTIR